MLDPLTSLGLVTNVVQLVEFGCNTLAKGYELASTGTTAEREHLRKLTRDTSCLCKELDAQLGHTEDDVLYGDGAKPSPQQIPVSHVRERLESPDVESLCATGEVGSQHRSKHSPEKGVRSIAHDAQDVAKELDNMLSKLSIKGAGDDNERPPKRRRTGATRVAQSLLKSVWKDKDVARLKTKMTDLQRNLILRMSVMQK